MSGLPLVHDCFVSVIPDFDRYAQAVYTGVRDGAVDREAAFDLANLVLVYYPRNGAARELAEASVTDCGEQRLIEAAGTLLAAQDWEPGFDVEPGLLRVLEQAMDTVNADLRSSDLPGVGRLLVPEWTTNAWVQSWDGTFGGGSGIFPASGGDPVSALVAVADEAQDAVMETIWEVWPVCDAHAIGVHAGLHDGAAVWWCSAGGGHVLAVIGQLGRR
jgi:hypothetical protein